MLAAATGVECFASEQATESFMTGQAPVDSYADAGLLAAVGLVNALAAVGGADRTADDHLVALRDVLAVDPASIAALRTADVPGFVELADELRAIFVSLDRQQVDRAAAAVNELLADHPAQPHLAKEEGRWRLHHHPVDAALVPMWTAICAEGLARAIGGGHADRLGTCDAADCGRAFVDLSKNGSRRFCSTTCQNRVKAAAFRRRRAALAG
jgi:predicted RNA-binding Zn ribbon-like protein